MTSKRSSKSKNQRNPFHFDRLPPELRNRIYSYALVTGGDSPLRYKFSRRNEKRTWSGLKNHKRADVGLLGVSKMISAEATKIFYSRNKFRLELFGSDFTAALRKDYLDCIKSVEVKLKLARLASSYGQRMEEVLAFRVPTMANLTTLTFRLEGQDLPGDAARTQQLVVACLKSLEKVKMVEIKGIQRSQHSDEPESARTWTLVKLFRRTLDWRWVEWVNDAINPTRVTFKKWDGKRPKSFKDWAPGRGRVNAAWKAQSELIDSALSEDADYTLWDSSNLVCNRTVVGGAGGILLPFR